LRQPGIPPTRAPRYNLRNPAALVPPKNAPSARFHAVSATDERKPAGEKNVVGPAPPPPGPRLGATRSRVPHGAPAVCARACVRRNLLLVSRRRGLKVGAFLSWSVLCAEPAERRCRRTPRSWGAPKGYCPRFWHSARLGVRKNLLPMCRTSGLAVGHFRASLGCVQSDRGAAPGARHGHGELPWVDANGYGTAHASWSALSAPRAQGPAPPKHRGLFGGARLPPGRQAAPPPRDHRAQHHRFGSERDLRGSEAPWGAPTPAFQGSLRPAEEEAALGTCQRGGRCACGVRHPPQHHRMRDTWCSGPGKISVRALWTATGPFSTSSCPFCSFMFPVRNFENLTLGSARNFETSGPEVRSISQKNETRACLRN